MSRTKLDVSFRFFRYAIPRRLRNRGTATRRRRSGRAPLGGSTTGGARSS
ncbi:unnamed protein product [Linum tenue]|uniref:Uncharacterized protein n=1 Tax=Linum tenue TaxID=586396 RepID=A0AAV0MU84_9ROSI|nr:unnamed protein product [Linum tenue]